MSGKPYSERESRAARLLKDFQEEQAGEPHPQGRSEESTRTTPEDLLVGEIALEQKLLTKKQFEQARRLQKVARANAQAFTLGETLLRQGFLKPDDLLGILKEVSRRSDGRPEIPRYEIRKRLGEGATAIVYGAWDRELRRPVALKVLRAGSEWSDVQRERFHRESQAAAGISHPNVVTVYDAGEAQGHPYLVMELVEGKPLSEVFKEQQVSAIELLKILVKVCGGVAAAHEKGIVHRDLKPGNILIAASGEPKVADFGLAHLLESPEQLTRTGTALGTPLYMSPEQVEGHSSAITPRTDVYGLGAVLFEAVTGRPPHTGQMVQEIYRKIVHEEPPSPSDLRPEVCADLQTVVLKALEKRPQDRYPSVEALAEDLRRYLHGEPILARPLSPLGRMSRKAFKYRAVLVPSICALLLGLLLVESWLARRGNKSTPIASLESVQGEVLLTNEAGAMPARSSQLLSSGDSVQTGKGSSWAVLTFVDGSKVEMGPETTIKRLARGTSWSSGHGGLETLLSMVEGSLVVEAVAQPNSMTLATPRGEVRLAGATIRLTSSEGVLGSTRLDVTEGSAQFVLPDGDALAIPRGSYVVASANTKPVPAPLPFDEMTRLSQESKSLTGTRRLVNRKSGKALAIQRGSKESGACAIQCAYGSEDSQLWRLRPAGTEGHRVDNLGTGKALDMLGGGGGGGGNGTHIVQSDPRDQSHQYWRITPNGGGYYRVINMRSGKALSVLGNSTEEGAYIVQWDYTGDPSQQWLLERP
jgi:serine/threonine protein kinase